MLLMEVDNDLRYFDTRDKFNNDQKRLSIFYELKAVLDLRSY